MTPSPAALDRRLLRLARTWGHTPANERAVRRFSALGEHAAVWLAQHRVAGCDVRRAGIVLARSGGRGGTAQHPARAGRQVRITVCAIASSILPVIVSDTARHEVRFPPRADEIRELDNPFEDGQLDAWLRQKELRYLEPGSFQVERVAAAGVA